jgi:hypothetical protein
VGPEGLHKKSFTQSGPEPATFQLVFGLYSYEMSDLSSDGCELEVFVFLDAASCSLVDIQGDSGGVTATDGAHF